MNEYQLRFVPFEQNWEKKKFHKMKNLETIVLVFKKCLVGVTFSPGLFWC